MQSGRYDALVDARVAAWLEKAGDHALVEALDKADQPDRFASQVMTAMARRLGQLPPEERVQLVNRIVELLHEPDAAITPPPRVLPSISGDAVRHGPAPHIPLSQPDLLVNARGEPQLAAELKKELASADQIDLIVAFVPVVRRPACHRRARGGNRSWCEGAAADYDVHRLDGGQGT